ncbi:MAG: hypothetical protein ACRCXZ_09425 [Patescibacteria group bacterium]
MNTESDCNVLENFKHFVPDPTHPNYTQNWPVNQNGFDVNKMCPDRWRAYFSIANLEDKAKFLANLTW